MTVNWRPLVTCACLVAVFGSSLAEAQPRRRPPSRSYAPIGLPDQAEGARILEASRQIGFGDSYYLELELRVLPRRGAEVVMPARWMGTENASGPVSRIEVTLADGTPGIWIVQGGEHPQAWRRDEHGQAVAVANPFEPLAGTQVSPVDLQSPFLRWSAFTYEGMLRFRGRPTHVFLLFPPDDQADAFPGIGGVRAFVDTEYNALSQVQWVDEEGDAIKTITAGSVRKVPGTDRWIITTLDVRDEKSRDKTRLVITGAALDIPIPGEAFMTGGALEPAMLALPPGAMRRFE